MVNKHQRVRKGSRGIYYTNGKVDKCEYNFKAAPFTLLQREIKDVLERMPEAFSMLFQSLLYLILSPILPIIRVLITQWKLRNIKIEKFSKDYYEIIEEYEYEDD